MGQGCARGRGRGRVRGRRRRRAARPPGGQAHRPQGRRSAYVRRLTIHHAALGRRRPCLAGRSGRLTDPRATRHERPDPHARGRQPGRPRCQDLRPVTRRLPLCRHGAGPGRGVDPDRLGQARHAGPHPGPRRRVAGLHDGSLPAIGDLVVRDRADATSPTASRGGRSTPRRSTGPRRPAAWPAAVRCCPTSAPARWRSAPGATPDRYAVDGRNRLWFLAPGESWRLLSDSRFTGLTYGR